MALEERLAALEGAVASLQENAERRIESGERLSRGVDRLAESTGGLNAVLSMFDEQQQRLSTLGGDLHRLESQAAKKEDLIKTTQELKRQEESFRVRVIKRGVMTGLGLLVLVLIIAAAATESSRKQGEETVRICKARNAQSEVFNTYIRDQIAIESRNKFIDNEIRGARIAALNQFAKGFTFVNCKGTKNK